MAARQVLGRKISFRLPFAPSHLETDMIASLAIKCFANTSVRLRSIELLECQIVSQAVLLVSCERQAELLVVLVVGNVPRLRQR